MGINFKAFTIVKIKSMNKIEFLLPIQKFKFDYFLLLNNCIET